MKYSILKKTRVAVSLLFLAATAFLFLDFTHSIPTTVFTPVTYLQFIPSLLKFFGPAALAAAGWIVVMLLTSLWGRIYCSTICPLGTFQDIVIRISHKFKENKKFKYASPLNILRYAILGVVVVLFFSGFVIATTFLDPYSNFGRITAQLFKPVFVGVNNLAAAVLKNFNAFWLYPAEIKGFSIASIILPMIILVTVVRLSTIKGRIYCNSICPVGTLLGLFSRISVFKISIDNASCDNCGKCGVVCKAQCISVKNKTVDFTRCVGCMNCLEACPTASITYSRVRSKKAHPSEPERRSTDDRKAHLHKPAQTPKDEAKRRSLLFAVGAFAFGYAGFALGQIKVKVYKNNTVPVLKKFPVSPPGSGSIPHFNENCTGCNLCVSACPMQVLQPAFLEYGFEGMFQPRLDYAAGYCTYDCTRCTDVCPSNAIVHLGVEEKKLVQLGKAKFIKENCVVETQKTDCGACSEHCPTKAVHMIPYNGLFLPEVRDQYCIGCGACEFSCPTVPYKAIYVEGNVIHQKAEKPKEEKLEPKVDTKNDFPF